MDHNRLFFKHNKCFQTILRKKGEQLSKNESESKAKTKPNKTKQKRKRSFNQPLVPGILKSYSIQNFFRQKSLKSWISHSRKFSDGSRCSNIRTELKGRSFDQVIMQKVLRLWISGRAMAVSTRGCGVDSCSVLNFFPSFQLCFKQ